MRHFLASGKLNARELTESNGRDSEYLNIAIEECITALRGIQVWPTKGLYLTYRTNTSAAM